MTSLTDTLLAAWEDRNAPVVLTTVDQAGMPNAIYATCVNHFGNDKLVVADNYFHKTKANLLKGTKGTILFMTNAGKSYQMKGTMSYHTEGEIFDVMKAWNPTRHPGHAAAVLSIEEVYSGAEKLI
jgi:predicted pyridoxine 5'-phosphate oxidase superfamily flavin-nucleotide-binding protein